MKEYNQETVDWLNDAFDEMMNGFSHDKNEKFMELQPSFYITKGTDESGKLYFAAMGRDGPISDRKQSIEEAQSALAAYPISAQCVYNGDRGEFETISKESQAI